MAVLVSTKTACSSDYSNKLIETSNDLSYLFFLATLSIYSDAEFCWSHSHASITFSYTEDGISLDKLWVPIRYRHQHYGRRTLLEFLRFFDAMSKSVPVFLTVAPLDSVTQAARLVHFYRSCGFRPTGFINAIGLPEMIHGTAIVK